MNVLLALFLTVLFGQVSSNLKIDGGVQAKHGQFPYIVSVKRWGSHHCGGSIISPTKILSAAHCYYRELASEYTIHAGIIDNLQEGQKHNVQRSSVHARFNPNYLTNDISTLHLVSSIQYDNAILPIYISTNYVADGVQCVVSGWGSNSNYSNVLKYVDLLTVTNDYCSDRLSHRREPILETNICTFTVLGEGICCADSGGPLVSGASQIGIASWGEPCGVGYPDVFVRVSQYIDWIHGN